MKKDGKTAIKVKWSKPLGEASIGLRKRLLLFELSNNALFEAFRSVARTKHTCHENQKAVVARRSRPTPPMSQANFTVPRQGTAGHGRAASWSDLSSLCHSGSNHAMGEGNEGRRCSTSAKQSTLRQVRCSLSQRCGKALWLGCFARPCGASHPRCAGRCLPLRWLYMTFSSLLSAADQRWVTLSSDWCLPPRPVFGECVYQCLPSFACGFILCSRWGVVGVRTWASNLQ